MPTLSARLFLSHTLSSHLVLNLSILCASFISVFQETCFSQEKSSINNAAAVKQLLDEYESHMGRQAGFEATYDRIANVMNETAREYSMLQIEGFLQQSAAESALMSEIELSLSIPANPRPTNTPAQRTNRNAVQRDIDAIRNRLNVEVALRSEQVRQLSAAQQTTVRRRLEALGDLSKLQQDVVGWKQKWPSFFESLWRFSDPEGTQTKLENEEILAQLKTASPTNISAKIVQGLVELRLHQSDEALGSLESALKQETMLSPIANAARSVVHAYRFEPKKSKSDILQAIKLAPKSPYVHWFRAELAAMNGEFPLAKKELAALLTRQEHEIAARRMLAIIGSSHPSKSSRESAITLQHAKLVSDLTGSENWYSELVLAMALNNSGNEIEALEKAQHAISLARDENLELCEVVLKWIDSKEPTLEWKFVR